MELLPPSVLQLYLQASPLSVKSLKLNNLQSIIPYVSLSMDNYFSHEAFPFPFGFTFGSSWNLLVSPVCKIWAVVRGLPGMNDRVLLEIAISNKKLVTLLANVLLDFTVGLLVI